MELRVRTAMTCGTSARRSRTLAPGRRRRGADRLLRLRDEAELLAAVLDALITGRAAAVASIDPTWVDLLRCRTRRGGGDAAHRRHDRHRPGRDGDEIVRGQRQNTMTASAIADRHRRRLGQRQLIDHCCDRPPRPERSTSTPPRRALSNSLDEELRALLGHDYGWSTDRAAGLDHRHPHQPTPSPGPRRHRLIWRDVLTRWRPRPRQG